MDFEGMFLKKYDIMKWDEFTVLNNDRKSVNEKIDLKVITKRELLSQFKVELSLLNACKHKIEDELKKTDEVIDTQILVLLCKRVMDLFDHMHILFSIGEELLTYYINFCQENVSYIKVDQLNILLDAVLGIENNKNIWIQLIKLHLNYNSYNKLLRVFQECINALKEDSLPLWKILIRHLRYRSPETVHKLLETGSDIHYDNISIEIRPKYLEWCIEFKDIDATRDLFNVLKVLKPESYKLYLTMIAIEFEEPNTELDTIRKLYEEACTLFGRNSYEVWLEYMRFEQNYGTKYFKYRIHNKALFRLDPSLMRTLSDECQKLEREFWTALGKEVIVIDD